MQEINEEQPMVSEDVASKIFEEFYPKGRIFEISYHHVPKAVMKHFEGKSKRFMSPENFAFGNFEQFFGIWPDYSNTTYAASQVKYHEDNGVEERLVYLYDLNGSKDYIGHGEIRFYPELEDPFFKDKPFVG